VNIQEDRARILRVEVPINSVEPLILANNGITVLRQIRNFQRQMCQSFELNGNFHFASLREAPTNGSGLQTHSVSPL
jgi:hypothetical protein